MINENNIVEAINWNKIEDEKDLEIWNALVTNFWIPEKISLANDIPTYNTLTDTEKWVTTRVFGGLTMLDTLQSTVGAIEMMKDAKSPHEEAVFGNIVFMECFTQEHQLYTTSGWKYINEITKDDYVVQFNADSKKMSFTKPNKISTHFSNDLYKISSENNEVVQIVSGGHRVYFEEFDKGEWHPIVIKARDLQNTNMDNLRYVLIGEDVERTFKSSIIDAEYDLVGCVLTTKKRTVPAKNTTIEKMEYGDNVYGIEVDNTFLYVRLGNSSYISGNCVHAKSYSNIFSTLCSTQEIDEIFRWTKENPYLIKKQELVLKHYKNDDEIMKKAASVLLESFLFYSGFYIAFYWASRAKLTNTSDVIRLIVRDEALHGYYTGYLAQKLFAKLSENEKQQYYDKIYELTQDLYENEVKYTEQLYDKIGLTEDVKRFIRYNANKALANMGLEPLFHESTTNVSASILTSLSPVSDETHDFFSGSGSSYLIAKVEDMTDDDWDI